MASLSGREDILRRLSKSLDAAAAGGGTALLLEGPAGIGKTYLGTAVVEEARARGFRVLAATAQPFAAQPFQLFEAALAAELGEPLVTARSARFAEVFAVTNEGLLMGHFRSGEGTAVDGDLFAGMLTAIQNFMRESFGEKGSGAGLRRLEHRDRKVLLETTPAFYVAAVIEGEEHEEMLPALAATVREVLDRSGPRLGAWSGEMGQLGDALEPLQALVRRRWRIARFPVGAELRAEKLRTFDRGLGLLLRLPPPVLVLLEDLHFADDASLEMLQYAARGVRGSKVLVLATARTEGGPALTAALRAMTAEDTVERVTLGGLAKEALTAVGEALLGGPLSEELRDALVLRTEGNPLFARELLEAGRREGAIERAGGVWTLRRAARLSAASVRDLIAQRLQGLDPRAFHILDLCACLGSEFDLGRIGLLAEGVAAAQLLQPLLDAGILAREGSRVRFEHPLVHESAYQAVGARRVAYHRRIATTLEREFTHRLDEVLYEVASHYGRSDAPAKALEFGERAGDRAASEHSPARAAEFYGSALEAIQNLPATEENHRRELALLEKLGDAATLGGEYDRALEVYARALAGHDAPEPRARLRRKRASVCEKKGEYAIALTEAFAGQGLVGKDTAEHWRLVSQRAYVLMRKGDLRAGADLALEATRELPRFPACERDLAEAQNTAGACLADLGELARALDLFRKALALREAVADDSGTASSLNNIGEIMRAQGELDAALGHYERCLRIGQRIGHLFAVASAHNNIGLIRLQHGDFPAAAESLAKCLEIFRRLGIPQGVAACHSNLGVAATELGEFDRALDHHRRALAVRQKTGDQWGVAASRNNLGDALRERGEPEEAVRQYTDGIALAREIGAKDVLTEGLLGLALTHAEAGRAAEARPFLQEAMALAAETGVRSTVALAERVAGVVAHRDGNWQGVEVAFGAAAKGLESLRAETELAKTLWAWSRALREKGEAERAAALLGKARPVFERSGMRAWLSRC